ncbi:MAG: UDP-2,3-diacylglucosamine diphosphatase [Sphingobacteriaceae bacterium]|nr:UDP-2,3-diacylglucosamine diphosphatase [Sphingobacteriaceae bacterium]
MTPGKKIYFASDFHLGIPDHEKSMIREKKIVRWLDSIKADAEEIYLVGDIFDFWWEYKHVIPKGYTRLFGKIAELTDSGIKVNFFTGNHDLWMKDYFTKELNVTVYHDPIVRTYGDKVFFIGHGDGLGPGDKKYKFLKAIFRSKVCQWLYARLHPNLGFALARMASIKSRVATGSSDEIFLGEENEWLYLFCKEHLKQNKVDLFIFGHRHLTLDMPLEGGKARYINLGQWLSCSNYGVFDGKELFIQTFEPK